MKQSVERLEKTLARVAKEQGLAQERLRRWVSFLALCGVLEQAVNEGILDNYDLNGASPLSFVLQKVLARRRTSTSGFGLGIVVTLPSPLPNKPLLPDMRCTRLS